MEKLAVCRICLDENVHVHVIENPQLQEIYERLTTIPFQTTDLRPLALCYICHGQLKSSRRLMLKCLNAEEVFSEMLNLMLANKAAVPDLTIIHRSALNQLSFTEIQKISIDSDDHSVVNSIKEEIQIEFEGRVKLEEMSMKDLPETADNTNSESDYEQSLSDPGNKMPLYNIEIVRKPEKVSEDDNKLNRCKQAAPVEKKPNLQPVLKKSIKGIKKVNADTDNDEAHEPKLNETILNPALNENDYIKITSNNVCPICGISFSDMNNLRAHASLHTGAKPYSCNICKKYFNNQSDLRAHTRTHNSEKPFFCDVCSKTFRDRTTFVLHQRTHTGEKPYVCDVCGKGFSQKGSLKTHAHTHTGDKPYVCDVCGKGFSQKNNLVIHGHIHTRVKPHDCDVCGKSYASKSALVLHARKHTGDRPFACNFCKRRFYRKYQLTSHIRSHTGEKPYVCDYCDSGFAQRCDLIKHIPIHTSDTQYVCKVCKKNFINMRALTTHRCFV